MELSARRYDLDWVRVIAIGLLLLYHTAIAFQPWGVMIGFIVSKESWTGLWIPMTMLNVWRIPLLFFVSGMGVYFSIQNRSWKQLLNERAMRILIPFLVGIFIIVPIGVFLTQYYYERRLFYIYHPGHLWFLGNIFVYVVLLLPVFMYLKHNENGRIVTALKKWLSQPCGLLPVFALFVAEVMLVDPGQFELYVLTWHGFFLGLIAFFFGFCFVLSGSSFWNMLLKWRWLWVACAAAFYVWRLIQPQMQVPNYLISVESNFWILSVFAFAYRYLNRGGKALNYLSQAAYPVYILHMIFLSLASVILFPLNMNVQLQFVLALLFTLAGCMITYEFLIRRVNFIRPLFGLKRMPSAGEKIQLAESKI